MQVESVDPVTDIRIGFHTTYLDVNGEKTEWDHTKRITPKVASDRNAVGVIKLRKGVGRASRCLAIGEGVETSLSFARIPAAKGAAIWCGLNGVNMA
jgi:hypothetical protein